MPLVLHAPQHLLNGRPTCGGLIENNMTLRVQILFAWQLGVNQSSTSNIMRLVSWTPDHKGCYCSLACVVVTLDENLHTHECPAARGILQVQLSFS